jgi:hypothetical protein
MSYPETSTIPGRGSVVGATRMPINSDDRKKKYARLLVVIEKRSPCFSISILKSVFSLMNFLI